MPRRAGQLLDHEGPRRRGREQVGVRHESVEPLHVLATLDDRAVPVLVARDLRIGGNGYYAVASGQSPIAGSHTAAR